jgi:hypothetical protein
VSGERFAPIYPHQLKEFDRGSEKARLPGVPFLFALLP